MPDPKKSKDANGKSIQDRARIPGIKSSAGVPGVKSTTGISGIKLPKGIPGRAGGSTHLVLRSDGYWVVKGVGGIVGAALGQPAESVFEITHDLVKPRRTDKEALLSDAEAIKRDIRTAVKRYEKETGSDK